MKSTRLAIPEILARLAAEKPLQRMGTITRAVDEAGKEIKDTYDVSFSSETETVQRWFGIEILSHKSGDVDMDWIKSSNAPLLLQHDQYEQIGVVDSAKIVERRGTARIRFGRSGRATEIKQDVDDGIRKNISVGYQTLGMKLIEEGDGAGKPDKYRVSWKPVEISIVSIPADETVGVGRSQNQEPSNPENDEMKRKFPQIFHNAPGESGGGGGAPATPPAPSIDLSSVRASAAEDARKAELRRMKDIQDITELHKGRLKGVEDMARQALSKGTELNEFRAQIVEAYGKGQEHLHQPGESGLSKKEERDLGKYSFARAMIAFAMNKPVDGLEGEMMAEGVREFKESGRQISGQELVIPSMVVRYRNPAHLQRSTVATVSGLVPLDIQPDFISVLRAQMLGVRAGTRYIPGLVGNIPFPKVSTGSSYSWLAENGDASDAGLAATSVTGTPHRLAGYIPLSMQFLMQSGDVVEQMVREDIAEGVATAVDGALIAGTGSSNQPTGILYTSGIGSVAGGTNGLAPTRAHLVSIRGAVGTANGDSPNSVFFTNEAVKTKLQGTIRVSSTDSLYTWPDDKDVLLGRPALVSNLVPSDLTKGTSSGVCSAIGYGDFTKTIVAQWGGLIITKDQITGLGANLVKYYVNSYWDVIVRNAAAFAAMKDALTA